MKIIMYMSYELAIPLSGIDHGKYLHMCPEREHSPPPPLRLASFRTIYTKMSNSKANRGQIKEACGPWAVSLFDMLIYMFICRVVD